MPEPLQGPPGERLCGVLGGSAAGILWPDVRGAGLWPGEGQAQATPRCALPWLMVLLGTGINLFGGLGPRGSLEVSRSYPSEQGPDQKVGALMGRHVMSSVCRPRPTEPQGREQTPSPRPWSALQGGAVVTPFVSGKDHMPSTCPHGGRAWASGFPSSLFTGDRPIPHPCRGPWVPPPSPSPGREPPVGSAFSLPPGDVPRGRGSEKVSDLLREAHLTGSRTRTHPSCQPVPLTYRPPSEAQRSGVA